MVCSCSHSNRWYILRWSRDKRLNVCVQLAIEYIHFFKTNPHFLCHFFSSFSKRAPIMSVVLRSKSILNIRQEAKITKTQNGNQWVLNCSRFIRDIKIENNWIIYMKNAWWQSILMLPTKNGLVQSEVSIGMMKFKGIAKWMKTLFSMDKNRWMKREKEWQKVNMKWDGNDALQ